MAFVESIEYSPNIQTVLDPKLFKLIESLSRTALSYGDNHNTIRTCIGNLCFYLQQQSLQNYGHLTIDTVTLKTLLKKTDPKYEFERPKPKLDVIEELGPLYQKKLTNDQQTAANQIRKVWAAFQKYLTVASRSYDTKSGKKNRVIQPLELMDPKLFVTYRNIYTPWYEKACRELVSSNDKRIITNEGDITTIIIVENIFPKELDLARNLKLGASIDILKKQLTLFNKYLV